MNVSEMFRSVVTTGTPAQGVPNPNLQTQAPAGAAANATVPSGATTVNQPGGPGAFPAVADPKADGDKSPLSGFEKLWETAAVDPKAPVAQPIVPSFNIDPAALNAAVAKMDFAGSISPELAKKALEGDATAFSQAINSAAQAAFSQSAQATSRIVEKAISQTVERMKETMLPAMLKEHSIATHVAAENPILNDPAVAPLANMLREQITAKNPNASAGEINTQVGQYLVGFAKMVTGAGIGASADTGADGKTVTRKTGGKADSWEDFFGVDS